MNKKYSGATRLIKSQSDKADYSATDLHNAKSRFEGLVNRMLVPDLTTVSVPSFVISKEVQDEAKEIIEKGFRSFINHSQQLADEIADFDKKREEVRRNIKRGARRTSGRII